MPRANAFPFCRPTETEVCEKTSSTSSDRNRFKILMKFDGIWVTISLLPFLHSFSKLHTVCTQLQNKRFEIRVILGKLQHIRVPQKAVICLKLIFGFKSSSLRQWLMLSFCCFTAWRILVQLTSKLKKCFSYYSIQTAVWPMRLSTISTSGPDRKVHLGFGFPVSFRLVFTAVAGTRTIGNFISSTEGHANQTNCWRLSMKPTTSLTGAYITFIIRSGLQNDFCRWSFTGNRLHLFWQQ